MYNVSKKANNCGKHSNTCTYFLRNAPSDVSSQVHEPDEDILTVIFWTSRITDRHGYGCFPKLDFLKGKKKFIFPKEV